MSIYYTIFVTLNTYNLYLIEYTITRIYFLLRFENSKLSIITVKKIFNDSLTNVYLAD